MDCKPTKWFDVPKMELKIYLKILKFLVSIFVFGVYALFSESFSDKTADPKNEKN